MFAIDKVSNYLRNIAPFDRESPYFADYLIPQIQIKLNLVCEPLVKSAINLQNISALYEDLSHEEIFYSTDVTILKIIILDQNDNSPIFTNPSEGTSIGFPDAILALKLMLPHLIQVESYDLDEGINAKIKYSLTDNHDFNIDSETGVIYPTKTCMRNTESLALTVIATDRDGASDGNSQRITINVRKLREENLVVLTIENQDLGSVEEMIKQTVASANLWLELHYLNFFAVPLDEVAESKQINTDTKIITNIYAFSDTGDLLTAQEILEVLSLAQLDGITSYSTFDDIIRRASDCSLTGLIVAVSVVGGLLLAISISAPLIWFFWLRHKISGSRRSSNLSEKNLENDYNNAMGRTSPMVDAISSSENETTVSDAEIIGIEIDGATEGINNILIKKT